MFGEPEHPFKKHQINLSLNTLKIELSIHEALGLHVKVFLRKQLSQDMLGKQTAL